MSEKEIQKDGLKKYGQDFQVSVLSLFFQNKSFTVKIKDVLDPSYFDNKYTEWFCKKGLEYLAKYINFPSAGKIFDILKSIVEIEVDEKISKTYLNVLEKIKIIDLSDRQYIEDEVFNFCFTKFALAKLEEQKNQILLRDFDKARQVAFNTYVPISQDHQELSLKENFDLSFKSKEHLNPIPLPFKTFTENTKGGPGAGDLVIVMAQSNFGKSNFLVAWARYCAEQGYNSIYFTLETKGEQLIDRTIAGLTKIDQERLIDHERIIESKVNRVKGDICFVKIKSTIARTEVVRQKIEEKKANGFFPDFIIIDGLNQLKTPKGMNFSGNTNDKFEYLAEEVRDMGDEYGIPTICAFQSNRCLALDTLVDLKDKGKIQIIDLKEGDEILTHKGYKKVNKIYPVEKQFTYKIILESGKEIICSKKHEFPILSNNFNLLSIENGLKEGDYFYTKCDAHEEFALKIEQVRNIIEWEEVDTIDICVDDTHMFFANDIYTHNSGYNTEYADEQSIGKSIEVFQVCDLMIFFTQSVPMQETGKCYGQLLKNRLGKKGLMLEIDYNPNQATFEEVCLVNRSALLNKDDKVKVIRSIDKVRQKNLEKHS